MRLVLSALAILGFVLAGKALPAHQMVLDLGLVGLIAVLLFTSWNRAANRVGANGYDFLRTPRSKLGVALIVVALLPALARFLRNELFEGRPGLTFAIAVLAVLAGFVGLGLIWRERLRTISNTPRWTG